MRFFTRAPKPAPVMVMEAIDPGIDSYDRLLGGNQSYWDLDHTRRQKAQKISVSLYRRSPVANRIISIYRSFLSGTGFSFTSKAPAVKAVLDEFWGSPRSDMERNHAGMARDWLLFGESFLPAGVEETVGNTTIGVIDPLRVKSISRSELNNLILTTLHVATRDTTATTVPVEIIRANDTMDNPDTAGMLEGEAFAWLFDRIGASTRGTPFMLPILDWLDAYDQVLWENVERTKAMRAFFWDVEVESGTIEEAQERWGKTPPTSGSVRFRTPGINVKAESPSLGSSEDAASARMHLRHITSGGGLAPHWVSDPEDANRSTADQMDRSVLKGLLDVQREWSMNMMQVGRFVVDQKVKAGMLDRFVSPESPGGQIVGEPQLARNTVEVQMPAVTDENLEEAAAALASVGSAAVQLDAVGALDLPILRRLMREMFTALGVPADELPDLEAEAAETREPGRFEDALESWARRR